LQYLQINCKKPLTQNRAAQQAAHKKKSMKKYTAALTKNETPIVVSAKNKRDAFEKIKAYRPETKFSDVVRF
jgi:hypothetical protein